MVDTIEILEVNVWKAEGLKWFKGFYIEGYVEANGHSFHVEVGIADGCSVKEELVSCSCGAGSKRLVEGECSIPGHSHPSELELDDVHQALHDVYRQAVKLLGEKPVREAATTVSNQPVY